MSVFPYFYSYLVIVPHQSIVAAGNITRVFSFTSTIASVVVSLFIKFSGHYKYFITAGAASYILGFALMVAFRGVNAPVATFVGTQILIGVGGGFINVPVQLGVQASVSHQHVASVTAVWLTIVEVGGAVGTAVSGALWSTYIPIKLEQYLPAGVDPVPIFANVVVSSNYTLYPSESPERIAINRAYQETMRYLLIGAICAAAPILPLSLCMKNYKLASMKQPVEGRVFGGTVEEGEERKD
jgi:SP family sugar:H+ symporter-like MFS transporter